MLVGVPMYCMDVLWSGAQKCPKHVVYTLESVVWTKARWAAGKEGTLLVLLSHTPVHAMGCWDRWLMVNVDEACYVRWVAGPTCVLRSCYVR